MKRSPRHHRSSTLLLSSAVAMRSRWWRGVTTGTTTSWRQLMRRAPLKQWILRTYCSCCTHQARQASPRALCTRPVATSLMWRTPIATFSTFIVTETCTGARPMSAGLLATHTSCMARLRTAPPRSCTKVYQTTRATTGSGRSSKSTRSPSSTPHRLRSERS